MNIAKVQLSPEELLLVQNAEWLLTKNRIIQKVYMMFGALASDVQDIFEEQPLMQAMPEVFATSAKIFKGENYRGLPYVMLDYPRSFNKHDIFAIRTMFWWGNFFSTTLHIKGKYKIELEPLILERVSILRDNHFYINVHPEEWRHDFEIDNYISFRDADTETVETNLINKEFFKIAGKIPLNDWDEVPVNLIRFYKLIIEAIAANFQGDEKGL